VPSEQLPLPVPPSDDEGPALHLPHRVVPMQATQIDAPFDDSDYFFEPWWPGVRAFALVERGHLRLQADGLADATATFPEMAELLSQLGEDGVVLDGTLLLLDDDGRPDGGLLRARLGGDAAAGHPAYVASDLLWAGGQPVTRRTFRVRRRWLEALLAAGDRVTVGHGYVGDGTLVAEALASLGIDGLSARQLSARYRGGPAGPAWLRASIIPPEPRARPTLALILRLPLTD
jgi:bifunctional non-homologous end joining protein LigD